MTRRELLALFAATVGAPPAENRGQEGSMPHVNHDGVRIHYEVEGTGAPLVLQHGFAFSLNRWHACGYVEALKPHFRLILIDARGHGDSDKPHDAASYALSLRVGDVVAVLDTLAIEKARYWGYSMGGWIGFGMAKYASERLQSLVIGGAHPYEQKVPPSSRLDGSDPDAFLAALFGRFGMDTATISPAIRQELLANDFRALAAARQDQPSLEDVLPTMTMPCCLYVGDADPLYPRVQQCAKAISNATFFALPGFDHGAVFRESRFTLPHVSSFLEAAGHRTAQRYRDTD